MSVRRIAKEFFKLHLPAELLQKINLKSLRLCKNTFIDEDFKASEVDVLYSVRIKNSIAYLYVLCEQQTEIDEQIAFRLLAYTVRIMKLHVKQFTNSDLPLIYPFVVYSGEKPWNAPMDIFPLFGSAESLARKFFCKPYQLLDIHRIPDEDLHRQDWCGLIEFVLKYRKMQDLAQFLETTLPWLNRLVGQDRIGKFLSEIILTYVADGIETNNHHVFIEKINQHLSTHLRGDAMTLRQAFEQLGFEKGVLEGIQQGILEGVQQGIKKGIQDGRQKAIKEILVDHVQHKFGFMPDQYQAQIEKADIDQLKDWTKAVITANAITEIFE